MLPNITSTIAINPKESKGSNLYITENGILVIPVEGVQWVDGRYEPQSYPVVGQARLYIRKYLFQIKLYEPIELS